MSCSKTSLVCGKWRALRFPNQHHGVQTHHADVAAIRNGAGQVLHRLPNLNFEFAALGDVAEEWEVFLSMGEELGDEFHQVAQRVHLLTQGNSELINQDVSQPRPGCDHFANDLRESWEFGDLDAPRLLQRILAQPLGNFGPRLSG